MGDVTGPISTLPGARHALPDGAMCDDHPDRPAVARVQGETDSFGCEMYDLCSECLEELELFGDSGGRCDWCKQDVTDLRPKRDIEEGLSGRVYYVCDPCAKRYDEAQEELDSELYDAFDRY